jgi:hypothetical protein
MCGSEMSPPCPRRAGVIREDSLLLSISVLRTDKKTYYDVPALIGLNDDCPMANGRYATNDPAWKTDKDQKDK